MSLTSFNFQILGPAQKHEIVQLRQQEYLFYYQQQVDLKTLEWNFADENSVHLGFYESTSQKLAACLRVSFFENIQNLEKAVRLPLPNDLSAPYALLSRAATRQEFQKQGLHAQLRCRALELCRVEGAECVLGTLEVRSSRMPQLISLGYNILSLHESWREGFIESSGAVALIGLCDRSAMQTAVERLRLELKLEPLENTSMKYALL